MQAEKKRLTEGGALRQKYQVYQTRSLNVQRPAQTSNPNRPAQGGGIFSEISLKGKGGFLQSTNPNECIS
jgi:hypothetical protein